MPDRNIATLLTPPGAAAIAVVRIRGPVVGTFLAAHFSRPAKPLRCVHGDFREDERVLDDIVVVLHDDGFTADLNLHGGAWVVSSVLELLKSKGFEQVDPSLDLLDGETILEREVHASLPLAKTEEGVRMLLAQPAAWEKFIASNPSEEAIRAVLEDRTLQRLLHPPRVAIVGAPNVGKSTLANQLFAQQRSITADLPGTTRDWVGEIANIDGLPVILIDTPGQRLTDDLIERAAIEQSGAVIAAADLVVHVTDPISSSVPLTTSVISRSVPLNVPLLKKGDTPAYLTLRVANKVDLGTPTEGTFEVAVVATTGAGLDELRRLIRQRLGCADLTPDRPRCWTARQRIALQRNPRDVLIGHQ